jgi:N-acetylglucosaminyldiphosphoundecaprenol N-acetyl-beta-D-mannosaminyltransferase
MIENLKAMFPNIEISGHICPENLSAEELAKKYNHIFEDLKVDIVWVSLGFPKQELFIQKVHKEIGPDTNFVGVGGVFEWVAGTKKKAPEWVANIGLEWVLRLVQDPKRLYKRYLIDNTLFVLYFLRQVLFRR